MKTISICNQKGGVGKTTTAINTAAYLAEVGQRVLLVDLDPQGNATSGLGIDKKTLTLSSYHLLIDQQDPRSIIRPTSVEKLAILPSTIDLTGAEVELVPQDRREFRLRERLASLQEAFDFILIDSPPSLGLLTINGLVAADRVLIPLQCEYYALEGLSQLLKTIELVKSTLNPSLEVEGIVLTMADHRTNLANEVITEAKTYFKEKVFNTIIPRSVRLSESPGFGKPISLYDGTSTGAQRYRALAHELLGHDTPVVEDQRSLATP